MTSRITVRLSNAELGALRREAAATGQPQAEVMRRALTERAVLSAIERAVAAKVAAALDPVASQLVVQHSALTELTSLIGSVMQRVREVATRDDLIKATNYLAESRRAGEAP